MQLIFLKSTPVHLEFKAYPGDEHHAVSKSVFIPFKGIPPTPEGALAACYSAVHSILRRTFFTSCFFGYFIVSWCFR